MPSVYASDGSTVLSSIVIWGAKTMYWFADAEALRIVTSDRHTFRKEVEAVRLAHFINDQI